MGPLVGRDLDLMDPPPPVNMPLVANKQRLRTATE